MRQPEMLLTKLNQQIPIICRWHFMWKASNAFKLCIMRLILERIVSLHYFDLCQCCTLHVLLLSSLLYFVC